MNKATSPIRRLTAAEARSTVLRRPAGSRRSYPEALLANLTDRFGAGATPESAVNSILESIRVEGESAARRWSLELDGVDPDPLVLTADILAEAWKATPASLQAILSQAADRIRRFHQLQPISSWRSDELGGSLGQRIGPIKRVGVYVPGGSAPLPSSLLMSVIPAQVAGVSQIILTTPPNPDPSILAAAHLCQIEQVVQLGGAQGIGAMAYGFEGLPPVDKIVGAGGLFVTLAKKAVFGEVGIDGLAGPTETMVIADDSANPEWVAADLLAQAEHDPLASALLLTTSQALAESVAAAIADQLPGLSRRQIIEQSLENNGAIVLVESLDQAAELADHFAAEHLCLSVRQPAELASKINNAGGLFIGEYSFEVLGDYVAGPSHIMPTGGTARFASPLSVLDFVKITTWVELPPAQGEALAAIASELAEVESLTAHAAAARFRSEGNHG